MSENAKRKIKNSLLVLISSAFLALGIRKAVDVYLAVFPVMQSESLDVIMLTLSVVSALCILTYAIAMRKKYSLVLATVLFGGGILEYGNNLFIINREINVNFKGLFLVLILFSMFMLVMENTDRTLKSWEFVVLFAIGMVILFLNTLAVSMGIIQEIYYTSAAAPYIEAFILATIPIFGFLYYNTKETKQNLFNSLFVVGAIFYTLSQVYYSLFYYRIYAPYYLTAQVFETFSFSLPILSTLVTLMASIAEKDRVINKSDILKKNLFMFFKSAEYNDLISVFVNDRFEIVYSNPKYRSYFGNSGKELQAELRDYLIEKAKRIKERKNYSSSIQIDLEGKQHILELDVVYIPSEDENVFCINAKDVTSFRVMQESLAKSENKYRSFFNLIPDFIFVYDIENGKILEANDAIYTEFDEVKRRNLGDDITRKLFETQGNFSLEKLAKTIYADDIIKLDTYKIYGENGKITYVEPNFRLIKVDGKAKQILVFLRNVTNAKKLDELRIENEDNLRRLYQAQEHEKVKNEFFANISHELRTPINVIFSALEVMDLHRNNEEKQDEYKSIIRQNSYRLLKLVNNILDSTKFDAKFYNIRLVNMDVVRLVEDTVTSVVPYASSRGIELVFDTEFEEKHIALDKDSLERVVLNLLSNAIKFTPPGGEIKVMISEQDDEVRISVSDTGIGIPSDKLKDIFDRFIQVNKSTTRDHEGTGIGLSIVDKLVDIMGGRCEVMSELEMGSDFSVILPDVQADDDGEGPESYEISRERVAIELSDI
jgi:signal transduction histidine kinase